MEKRKINNREEYDIFCTELKNDGYRLADEYKPKEFPCFVIAEYVYTSVNIWCYFDFIYKSDF